MNNVQSLLRTNQYRINDMITIYVPTIGEIYDYGEDEYYNIVQSLTAVPYDLMVQFDDMGIDYETIDEYELFLMMLESFIANEKDLSIIFKDMNLSELKVAKNNENGEYVIINKNYDCVIDKLIQYQICDAIRKIHFLEKTLNHAGNAETKKYLIDRNRLKQKRAASKKKSAFSFLDENVIKMVNTEEFKYNYEQCMDLSIYKFNASLRQIPKKRNWDELMMGAYFGTIDLKKLNIDKIHWMSSLTS